VRLYPPYLVALLFSMAIVVATAVLRPELPLVASYPEPRASWIGADLVAHLLMLHGLHPAFDRAGGNAPFWTLAREEYFYLMYFGLLAVRRRVGPLKAVAGAAALGLVFPYLFRPFLAADSAWWGVINTSSIALWGQWCLGLLAAEAAHGVITLPAFTRDLRLVPAWAVVATAAAAVSPVGLAPLAWGMTFFTLVNAVVAREQQGRWSRGPAARWFAGLGVFAYSLYLIHHPLRGLVKRLLEGWISRGDLVTYLAANAVVVLVALAAARFFFEQVESRFLAPRRR
jgi:peptidoglycan/LPS O-acetylase OafA/YrhL